MTGRLSGSVEAETFKAVARPAILVELHFAAETMFLWSGVGTLIWNGCTWLGVGTLGRVGSIEETLDVRAVGARFELSGERHRLLSVHLRSGLAGGLIRSPGLLASSRPLA
ncbi:hypothetical protein WCLP8_40003 [uncultured Gammaproteobacteria bacterium]